MSRPPCGNSLYSFRCEFVNAYAHQKLQVNTQTAMWTNRWFSCTIQTEASECDKRSEPL